MKLSYYVIVLLIQFLISFTNLSGALEFSKIETLPRNEILIDKIIDESNKFNELDTNILYANYAYKFSEEIGYDLGKIKSLHILGLNYYLAGDYERAIFFLLKEAKIIQSDDKFKQYLAENYRMLGEVNRASREFNLAFDYLEKAEKLFKENKDLFGLAKTYNRMAAVKLHIDYKNPNNKILEYLKKSNDIAIQNDYIPIIINNLNVEGNYYLTKDVKKALEILRKILDYFQHDYEDTEKANFFHNLSNLYLLNNKPDSALKYIRLSYEEALKTQINIFIYGAALSQSEIYYKEFQNIDSAYHYLKIAQFLQFEIYDDTKRRSQLLMQFKYESDIKDKEIDEQKRSNSYQIIIFTLLILVLATIIAFYHKNSKKMKEANQIINKQKEELTQFNNTKDKLFSIIAHDLRNPVGAFKSISVMLDEDYFSFSDSERREFIRLMKISSENLLSLLENLLTWSRSQSGKISFNPTEENLFYIVNNILLILKTNADAKGIKFLSKLPKDCYAYFDASMIQIVLMNIISNSIKFSQTDTTIIIDYEYDEKIDNNYVKLSIQDEGRGMSQSQIDMLFLISENQSTDGTNGEKGTGLGMVIVAEFIEKNKGKINVVSEIGKGTTMEILLPRYSPDSTQPSNQ